MRLHHLTAIALALASWGPAGIAMAGIDFQGDEGPSSLVLSLAGDCPGTITLEWRGAKPNQRLALLHAASRGDAAIPGGQPCAGTRLGLATDQLKVITTLSAGREGRGRAQGTVAAESCGTPLQLLAVSAPTCATSNVATIPGE